MLVEKLKHRLIEADHPVGVKKHSLWKLPPPEFSYGYPVKPDPEGVSIITRSWNVHNPTTVSQPPQDFITINKMAIKVNATSPKANKDFRRSIDIREKVKHGRLNKSVKLPPENFAYGVPVRPGTPIKDIVNNIFGNRAEAIIRRDYDNFIKEKEKFKKGPPKVVPRYINPLVYELKAKEEEERKNKEELEKEVVDPLDEEVEPEPPLWKMRMFRDVGSKVAEGIKKFKTYENYKKNDGLDNLIKSVQHEINENEKLYTPNVRYTDHSYV